jgi:undecaprenyl diphosphate synthase
MAKNNIPRHIGFIPDGNRRWAVDRGLPKEAGYAHGINPGLLLFEKCKECGIKDSGQHQAAFHSETGIQRGQRCIRF